MKKLLKGKPLLKRELNRLIAGGRKYSQKVLAKQAKWRDERDLFWIEFISDKRLRSGKPAKIKQLLVLLRKKQGRCPNPEVVASEVKTYYVGVPYAGITGDLAISAWNMLNADNSKVDFYAKAIKEIILHFHIICLEEVSPEAVGKIASQTGYESHASYANSRGQAVGILTYPGRLEVLGSGMYTDIADVQGIPDLRPALWVTVRDKVTDVVFTIVVVHLKSMRGGVEATSIVRREQIEKLVRDIGPDFVGIIGGDFNFPVNNPNFKEAEPFYQAGFTLVAKGDTRMTQSLGSRLDAFFFKGFPVKTEKAQMEIGCYEVRPYFLNRNITRQFSDHATISAHLLLASTVKLQPATIGGVKQSRAKSASSRSTRAKTSTQSKCTKRVKIKGNKATQQKTKAKANVKAVVKKPVRQKKQQHKQSRQLGQDQKPNRVQ